MFEKCKKMITEFRNEELKKNYVKKTDVAKCFDDVAWETKSFYFGAVLIKDNLSHTKFYVAKDIDKAIKKLNKLLRE